MILWTPQRQKPNFIVFSTAIVTWDLWAKFSLKICFICPLRCFQNIWISALTWNIERKILISSFPETQVDLTTLELDCTADRVGRSSSILLSPGGGEPTWWCIWIPSPPPLKQYLIPNRFLKNLFKARHNYLTSIKGGGMGNSTS